MLFTNKTAIVTGAGRQSGLGFATAKILAEQGARVALVDLDGQAARASAAALGREHKAYALDVSDRAAAFETVKSIAADFGKIDSLLTFAGISLPTPFNDISQDEYEKVMGVNFGGTINMCQAVAPFMLDQGGGAILAVGSIAGLRGGGIFGSSHYSASKGAVHSLAKALARELGPKNIRVNAIAPGLISTELFGEALSKDRQADISESVPLKRLGRPEDVARASAFLVSDWAAYINGETLNVSGGLHMS